MEKLSIHKRRGNEKNFTLVGPFYLNGTDVSVIYFFIDGIGIGPDDQATNPFSRYATSVLSVCSASSRADALSRDFLLLPLDAAMGIDGLPQSATGQTSLWTGVNAPQLLGHHLTGFPGPTLRAAIEEHSILKKFKNEGFAATLLNAYSEKFLKKLESMPRFASASTHTQKASGQPLFTLADLEAGRALYMDITHQIMHQYYPETKERFPIVDAHTRGADLVRIAQDYELVIFEYFLSDKAGHSQDFDAAQFVIESLETFIKGICEAMGPDDTLIISSDHGNLEDLSTKTHTHHSVPLLVYGRLMKDLAGDMQYLYDIPRRLYEIYGFALPPLILPQRPRAG